MPTAIRKAQQPTSEAIQYVSFYVGDMLLGLPIHQVQEINRHLEVTRVPHAGASIRGVINLRGDVVTVVDLPKILGFGQAKITASSRNVIIHYQGELIGLLVDDVADILAIRRREIRPSPANVKVLDGRFIHGVYSTADQIVLILDVAEALA